MSRPLGTAALAGVLFAGLLTPGAAQDPPGTQDPLAVFARIAEAPRAFLAAESGDPAALDGAIAALAEPNRLRRRAGGAAGRSVDRAAAELESVVSALETLQDFIGPPEGKAAAAATAGRGERWIKAFLALAQNAAKDKEDALYEAENALISALIPARAAAEALRSELERRQREPEPDARDAADPESVEEEASASGAASWSESRRFFDGDEARGGAQTPPPQAASAGPAFLTPAARVPAADPARTGKTPSQPPAREKRAETADNGARPGGPWNSLVSAVRGAWDRGFSAAEKVFDPLKLKAWVNRDADEIKSLRDAAVALGDSYDRLAERLLAADLKILDSRFWSLKRGKAESPAYAIGFEGAYEAYQGKDQIAVLADYWRRRKDGGALIEWIPKWLKEDPGAQGFLEIMDRVEELHHWRGKKSEELTGVEALDRLRFYRGLLNGEPARAYGPPARRRGHEAYRAHAAARAELNAELGKLPLLEALAAEDETFAPMARNARERVEDLEQTLGRAEADRDLAGALDAETYFRELALARVQRAGRSVGLRLDAWMVFGPGEFPPPADPADEPARVRSGWAFHKPDGSGVLLAQGLPPIRFEAIKDANGAPSYKYRIDWGAATLETEGPDPARFSWDGIESGTVRAGGELLPVRREGRDLLVTRSAGSAAETHLLSPQGGSRLLRVEGPGGRTEFAEDGTRKFYRAGLLEHTAWPLDLKDGSLRFSAGVPEATRQAFERTAPLALAVLGSHAREQELTLASSELRTVRGSAYLWLSYRTTSGRSRDFAIGEDGKAYDLTQGRGLFALPEAGIEAYNSRRGEVQVRFDSGARGYRIFDADYSFRFAGFREDSGRAYALFRDSENRERRLDLGEHARNAPLDERELTERLLKAAPRAIERGFEEYALRFVPQSGAVEGVFPGTEIAEPLAGGISWLIDKAGWYGAVDTMGSKLEAAVASGDERKFKQSARELESLPPDGGSKELESWATRLRKDEELYWQLKARVLTQRYDRLAGQGLPPDLARLFAYDDAEPAAGELASYLLNRYGSAGAIERYSSADPLLGAGLRFARSAPDIGAQLLLISVTGRLPGFSAGAGARAVQAYKTYLLGGFAFHAGESGARALWHSKTPEERNQALAEFIESAGSFGLMYAGGRMFRAARAKSPGRGAEALKASSEAAAWEAFVRASDEALLRQAEGRRSAAEHVRLRRNQFESLVRDLEAQSRSLTGDRPPTDAELAQAYRTAQRAGQIYYDFELYRYSSSARTAKAYRQALGRIEQTGAGPVGRAYELGPARTEVQVLPPAEAARIIAEAAPRVEARWKAMEGERARQGRPIKPEERLQILDELWAEEGAPRLFDTDAGLTQKGLGKGSIAEVLVTDHHGAYGDARTAEINATKLLLRDIETAVKRHGMEAAKQYLRRKYSRVSTDNLGDGIRSLQIIRHLDAVVENPALRKVLSRATWYEDFGHFGPKADATAKSHPALREAIELQDASFRIYDEALARSGVKTADRFADLPADAQAALLNRVMDGMERVLRDPAYRREKASAFREELADARRQVLAQERPALSEQSRAALVRDGVDPSILDQIFIYDETLIRAGLFARWGGPARAHAKPYQLNVWRMGDRTGFVMAIPQGTKSPWIAEVAQRIRKANQAKAEMLAREKGIPASELRTGTVGDRLGRLEFSFDGVLLTPQEVMVEIARHLHTVELHRVIREQGELAQFKKQEARVTDDASAYAEAAAARGRMEAASKQMEALGGWDLPPGALDYNAGLKAVLDQIGSGRRDVVIVGPPGAGKTTLVEALKGRLKGKDYRVFDYDEGVLPSEVAEAGEAGAIRIFAGYRAFESARDFGLARPLTVRVEAPYALLEKRIAARGDRKVASARQLLDDLPYLYENSMHQMPDPMIRIDTSR